MELFKIEIIKRDKYNWNAFRFEFKSKFKTDSTSYSGATIQSDAFVYWRDQQKYAENLWLEYRFIRCLGCLLPDWGSIAILDDFSSQMDGEIQSLSGLELDVGDIIKSFVDDLEVLFDIKNLKMGRILENLKTSSNSMVSLSSLLQRVHVSLSIPLTVLMTNNLSKY